MVTIRSARQGDEDEIAHVHVKTWQESYKPFFSVEFLNEIDIEQKKEAWRNTILKSENNPEKFGLLVSCNGDHITGFICMVPSRKDNADMNDGEVSALYIDPVYQGQGIGKKLLDQSFIWFKERGFTNVMIRTLEKADSAKFYARNKGDMQVETINRDFGNGHTHTLVEFHWDL